MPPAILARLNAEVNVALGDARLRATYEGAAMRPVGGSAADLGKLLRGDYQRFGKLTRS